MRITYIARHYSGSNDDEGSVAHALDKLGHKVVRVNERRVTSADGDFVLFHNWTDYQRMSEIKIPRVFWYFDLVDFPDPSLRGRCQARMHWMQEVTRLAHLGFCTDGDWVNRDNSGKLVWLTQGADHRLVRVARYAPANTSPNDILFTGITRGGIVRESFVAEMQAKYGNRFTMFKSGLHGLALARTITNSKIVVAPDGPVTRNYWSNRVYNTLGFGGFLLHPYCERLREHYNPEELVMYKSRQELHELIEHYLPLAEERARVSSAALVRTYNEHTYLHRVRQMVQTVKERLGL